MLPRIALLLLCLLLPAPSIAQEEKSTTLRVVAYNIKHGRGMDGKVDLERVAKVLRALKPDVIALQEIDNKCTRSGKVDQAAELGRLLGMKHRFGKFMNFQGGEYGLAVLSRHPIEKSERHQLAPGAEPRCALEIVIQPKDSNTAISFVSIHNDWTKESLRIPQVTDLLRGLKDRKHPIILAGDFNAEPGDKSLALLKKDGYQFVSKNGAKTFPSPKPTVEIDYVLTKGLTFEKAPTCSVIDERVASDHRPLLSVIPLPGK